MFIFVCLGKSSGWQIRDTEGLVWGEHLELKMIWNKSVNTFIGKLDMQNGNGERHPGDRVTILWLRIKVMLVDEVVQGDKVELELVEDCILGEVDI